MAEHSSMLHVRIDDETKALATEALAAMGLAISDGGAAVPAPGRDRSGGPLEMKVPNAETRAAMEESRALLAARRVRFALAEEERAGRS